MPVWCGSNHTIALDNAGYVWVFGENRNGELATIPQKTLIPKRVEQLENIIQVSCGSSFNICLDAEGNVWSFGEWKGGRLGRPGACFLPQQIPALREIKRISCGESHTLCVDASGDAYIFGVDQFCTPRHTNLYGATKKVNLTNVKDVAAGQHHSLFLREDGSIFACGEPKGTGFKETIYISEPKKYTDVDSVFVSIKAGDFHNLVLDTNDIIYSFGENEYGQLGLGNRTAAQSITALSFFENIDIKSIHCGSTWSVVLTESGEVYGFGKCHAFHLLGGSSPATIAPCQLKLPFVYVVSDGGDRIIFKTESDIYSYSSSTQYCPCDGPVSENHTFPPEHYDTIGFEVSAFSKVKSARSFK